MVLLYLSELLLLANSVIKNWFPVGMWNKELESILVLNLQESWYRRFGEQASVFIKSYLKGRSYICLIFCKRLGGACL